MAILDTTNEFSDAQAVTASAISTNVIDLLPAAIGGNILTDLGATDEIYLSIFVQTTATSAGASTVTFSLESDSTVDLATSATVHWTSSAVAKASLVAGYKVATICLPQGSYERYLGLRYTVATADLTAGKFDAFLHVGIDNYRFYKPGSLIS